MAMSVATVHLPNHRFHGHHLVAKRTVMGHSLHYESSTVRRLVVTAATEGSRKSKESEPSWANPDSDEPPPWARNEGGSSTSQDSFEIPFYVYLLASAITAIAAIGSIFEYSSKNPVFGVLGSDSIFYTPVLGFFALTGIPTSVISLYSCGSNPLKLLIRKLKNKIREMAFYKTLLCVSATHIVIVVLHIL